MISQDPYFPDSVLSAMLDFFSLCQLFWQKDAWGEFVLSFNTERNLKLSMFLPHFFSRGINQNIALHTASTETTFARAKVPCLVPLLFPHYISFWGHPVW